MALSGRSCWAQHVRAEEFLLSAHRATYIFPIDARRSHGCRTVLRWCLSSCAKFPCGARNWCPGIRLNWFRSPLATILTRRIYHTLFLFAGLWFPNYSPSASKLKMVAKIQQTEVFAKSIILHPKANFIKALNEQTINPNFNIKTNTMFTLPKHHINDC